LRQDGNVGELESDSDQRMLRGQTHQCRPVHAKRAIECGQRQIDALSGDSEEKVVQETEARRHADQEAGADQHCCETFFLAHTFVVDAGAREDGREQRDGAEPLHVDIELSGIYPHCVGRRDGGDDAKQDELQPERQSRTMRGSGGVWCDLWVKKEVTVRLREGEFTPREVNVSFRRLACTARP
jgi:hypothetical protein